VSTAGKLDREGEGEGEGDDIVYED